MISLANYLVLAAILFAIGDAYEETIARDREADAAFR